ncbi:cell division protein FtsH [Entomoplasma ellychniae]|uniref:ATP-dependent zinc metalloprotease FtsH n=1 Tax=Entomoplasma ellychniae TaxID=2114 RepID=A0A8E2UCV9_9MOLU|nr:ATP-dependent zinc metalloprotease FtsH [Entomoplasma ellychniae]PPE04787.1 cell division protein FtsH [Entomoplasma ellychniae]
MTNKKSKSTLWAWIIIIAAILIISAIVAVSSEGTTEKINWAQLEKWIIASAPTPNPKDNPVWANVIVYNNAYNTSIVTGLHQITGEDGVARYVKFKAYIQTSNISLEIKTDAGTTVTVGKIWEALQYTGQTWVALLSSLLPMLLMIVVCGSLIYFMMKSSAGAGSASGGIFGMGKNRARAEKSLVKFSDVAGIEEDKSELIELVDYLKNPTKYEEAGARAPKGVLMEGPPGTGKTLLAKAVAGEAGVSFFSIAGSEFEEMFVGVGASRVREMFSDAKKTAPAIIFIDEIDAVGRKRNGNIGGAGSEQTLNQLLVEMDGFGTNSGIIVMAATNRADVLDPALLRPGRFDRVIQVTLPDIKERKSILELHAKGKKIDKTVDWYRVAERTPGFSGAQLENVLNEAAILMVRENKNIISIVEIDEAIDRVVGGPAKKSRAMTKLDKDIVSYHESGHALIGLKLDSASKVQKVTIIPRGNAGGYTIMTPKDETVFSSKKDLLANIAGYLGGRAAEEIKFGKDNVTTGAHDDLDKATNIARRMVVQFGMSSLGMTKFLTMAEESYGKIEGTYSDETAARIDAEISKILEESYIISLKVIKENMDTLELLAESLRVLETITAEQIDYIHKNKKLPPEVVEQKAKLTPEEPVLEIKVEESKEDAE